MLKKIVASLAMLAAATAFAAVEANKATPAELDGLKGVGPAMSQGIVDARKQGEFKSWDDFMARVKGVKAKKAAKLSGEGLTVNGQPFQGAGAAPAAGKQAAAAAAPKGAPAKQ
ncbi:helix-hairpin-helix domain-containing protein [Variovorax sp. OV329]|uniref:ComEA family DNA-binding protein n=1 Tax=Variovorax sp. OV329 TaxID=1882825 RepID=UPI0008E939D7|nr:helix-hairpin-helix domain-containing protein [Variovorax sp. OV329]SFM22542.1 competence protein ComEA [Variovorax sp. OV329]